MTANQLDYWRNKETERTNRAREAETRRANLANESLTASQISETGRHNLQTESLSAQELAERARHNKKQESIDTARAVTSGIRDVSQGVSSLVDSGVKVYTTAKNPLAGIGSQRSSSAPNQGTQWTPPEWKPSQHQNWSLK